jgi:UDP-2,3-diacylglucosamine pyrophosphatase LpxH
MSIRYACISDTHLGDDASLLTNIVNGEPDLSTASPTLIALVDCLRDVIGGDRPTLLMAGDILELALAKTDTASMAFERFFELIMPKDETKRLFDKVIYLPGNHDHHLWEIARETQYVNLIKNLGSDVGLPTPWHKTRMLFDAGDATPSYFLNNLISGHMKLSGIDITVAYPNYGILSPDGRRCAVVHHGHYVEAAYYLVSTLKTWLFPGSRLPVTVNELEAENFAWIDFFWSALGRSGDAGTDVERIYRKLGDRKELKKLINNLMDSLVKHFGMKSKIGDKIEAAVLKSFSGAIADLIMSMERKQGEDELSDDATKGFKRYTRRQIMNQLEEDLKGGPMPRDFKVIFGHTHKPFQEEMRIKNLPQGVNNVFDVYNTGGWVVDTVKAQKLHGGAVVLLDEELNAASLRMYNEAKSRDDYEVRVEEAAFDPITPNPFFQEIRDRVDPSADPWRSFSRTVASEVRLREQDLEREMED